MKKIELPEPISGGLLLSNLPKILATRNHPKVISQNVIFARTSENIWSQRKNLKNSRQKSFIYIWTRKKKRRR